MGSSEARISSVKKAINIIELLRNNDDATTKEVAEALDISKTSAYYYLQTLSESGYVVNDDGRYSLSLRIFTLGADIRSRQPVYRNICGQVNRLANKTGELSLFMLEEEGMGTYVYMSRGKNAGIKSDWLGNRCHLHNNALGKAILSVLPKSSVRKIIRDHGLPKSTENTITEKKRYLMSLAKLGKEVSHLIMRNKSTVFSASLLQSLILTRIISQRQERFASPVLRAGWTGIDVMRNSLASFKMRQT